MYEDDMKFHTDIQYTSTVSKHGVIMQVLYRYINSTVLCTLLEYDSNVVHMNTYSKLMYNITYCTLYNT